MNVLVYDGPGVSPSALAQTLRALRSFLASSHDVHTVSSSVLANDPWPANTSLLVIPGGRDIPYQSALSGKANRRIRNWVECGGKYLGICAGAYYASRSLVFEEGTPLEVKGERELAFYPGECRGTVFPGFVYESDAGARAVSIKLERRAWMDVHPDAPDQLTVYYNGGGAFFDADRYDGQGVTVLARYADLQSHPAAGVRCDVGKGAAVLFTVHPEFGPGGVDSAHPATGGMSDDDAILAKERLAKSERERLSLLRATLRMLGLNVSDQTLFRNPNLTPQFLASRLPNRAVDLVNGMEDIAVAPGRRAAHHTTIPPILTIAEANDTFLFYPAPAAEDVIEATEREDYEAEADKRGAAEVDLHKIPKRVLVFDGEWPGKALTPFFDMAEYFSSLEGVRKMLGGGSRKTEGLGDTVMYAEVVTSTQTMLDKNFRFLTHVPTGLISVATRQMSGRGRSSNRWISPPGCLQFSLVLRLPQSLAAKVVFVQYLFGLAVVQAVANLGEGYDRLGVRLKWPNDIYAEVPASRQGAIEREGRWYLKMGGILVNSQFSSGQFVLIVGCGVNTTNSLPTTSLSDLISLYNESLPANAPASARLAPISQERFLGTIIATFERMWERFLADGRWESFQDTYENTWLHSGQEVHVAETDNTPGTRVRIIGITPDYGLLRSVPAEDGALAAASENPFAQRFIDLQPDGNGFDMLANLIRKKT